MEGDLSLSVAALSGAWPQGIRDEIASLGDGLEVSLPLSEVAAGVAKGKVLFTWGQIRAGLTPALDGTSQDESQALACPLKVVAPAFMAAKGGVRRVAPNKEVVDTSLPDFFGPTAGRQAEPVAEAPNVVDATPAFRTVPAHVEPEAPVEVAPMPAFKLAQAPAAQSAPSEPKTLSEFFGKMQLAWTPKEIVAETCQLPGMVGSVVALDEGFIIAHQLPEGLPAEAFGAFLPNLFTRVNKYTGEMQLGDTNEIAITTEGGTFMLLQRGKLFFAALAEPGTNLPTAGLRLAADELNRGQNS
jgi:predicted regulator of Ras-like GTPase activity (Roadblock/LC7/MglB family)